MVKQEKTERLDGESTIAAQVIMFKGRIYDFFLFRSDFFIKQNIFQHVLLLYHHQAVTCNCCCYLTSYWVEKELERERSERIFQITRSLLTQMKNLGLFQYSQTHSWATDSFIWFTLWLTSSTVRLSLILWYLMVFMSVLCSNPLDHDLSHSLNVPIIVEDSQWLTKWKGFVTALSVLRSLLCHYMYLRIFGCPWFFFPKAPLFPPEMDASYGGGLFDMVKGGAGKFFSNFKDNLKDTLKDTSTKVMHQVATWVP